eukprot:scaffold58681_cov69-Phaeocystis_antarctica.AAC.1
MPTPTPVSCAWTMNARNSFVSATSSRHRAATSCGSISSPKAWIFKIVMSKSHTTKRAPPSHAIASCSATVGRGASEEAPCEEEAFSFAGSYDMKARARGGCCTGPQLWTCSVL